MTLIVRYNRRMARTVSRRDVLKGGLLLGSAASLAPLARALNQDPDGKFAFAYYSDTHVGLEARVDVNIEMVKEMKAAFDPLFGLNGGDVTDYGWKGEYDNHKKVVAASQVPVFHSPGNHDVRWSGLGLKIFEQYVGPPYSSFESHGCIFFLLDSTVPLSHWGHFERPMLKWLDEELKKAGRETPAFIVTHHWVGRDDDRVDNENDLLKIIEPYNIKIILNGHGHSDLLWNWDGIAGTMNQGLYQGSYQRITVDRERGMVMLDRRTTEVPTLTKVAELPLQPSRDRRPVWALGAASVQAGECVPVELSAPREYRWNKGEWAPLNGGAPTDGLYAGHNVLALRKGEGMIPQRFGINVIEESPLLPRWEVALTGGVMGHLLLRHDALYVTCMDGAVYRIDPFQGDVAWRAQTGGYNHSSPALHEGVVVVGSADNFVYGLDSKTGNKLWKTQTRGPVYGTADFAKGVAAIESGDGYVYGLDPKTGEKRWDLQLPVSDSSFGQSRATTDGERFFVTSWDNMLYAVDATTGNVAWQAGCCDDMSFHYSAAIAWPAVAHGNVYAVANGNRMYCFDAETGQEKWVYSSPGDKVGYSSPVVVGERIFVGCLGDNGEARCVHAITGEELWKADIGEVIYEGSAAVTKGLACISSVSGLISCMDVETGAVKARWRMPAGLGLSTPAAERGRLYVSSYCGKLFAFRVTD